MRVADAGLLAGGADGARADADLDDVGAAEDELLRHLLRDDIAGHDGDVGPALAHVPDALHEGLGVAIRDIDADHLDLGDCHQKLGELILVLLQDSGARRDVGDAGLARAGSPGLPLVDGVVLVHRRDAFPVRELLSHLERANRVHVRSNQGHTGPLQLGVRELVGAIERDLGAARQGGPLRPDQHILEVKLRLSLDDRHGSRWGRYGPGF